MGVENRNESDSLISGMKIYGHQISPLRIGGLPKDARAIYRKMDVPQPTREDKRPRRITRKDIGPRQRKTLQDRKSKKAVQFFKTSVIESRSNNIKLKLLNFGRFVGVGKDSGNL